MLIPKITEQGIINSILFRSVVLTTVITPTQISGIRNIKRRIQEVKVSKDMHHLFSSDGS